MIIHPEVIVTPDCPTVKFREDPESIDLPKVLDNVLKHQGWGVGTHFHVQFVSHDRTELLSFAEFVVTSVKEDLVTNEANPYQPMTRLVASRRCAQVTEWWPSGLKHMEGEEVTVLAGSGTAKWNVGKKAYDVIVDGIVIDTVKDKDEAERLAGVKAA